MSDRDAALARGRRALREGEGASASLLRFVQPSDRPAAFLTTLSGAPIVIPLRAGITFVGRSRAHSEHQGWSTPFPVEGVQWFIRCEHGVAAAADAASTNQSVVIRAGATLPQPCSLATVHQLAHRGDADFVAILHQPPQPLADLRWARLDEGDALVTVYAALVFGWAGAQVPT